MKFWIVIDKQDDVYADTLRRYKKDSITAMMKNGAPHLKTWKDWKAAGFDCVRCTLYLGDDSKN